MNRANRPDSTEHDDASASQVEVSPPSGTLPRERVIEGTQSASELSKEALFLHTIVDNLPHMIFVKDAKELRYVLFNRAAKEFLGGPPERFIGATDYDLFPREQADFFVNLDRQTLESRATLTLPEETVFSPVVGRRTITTKKIPLVVEDGTPEYVLGMSLDITQYKDAQAELEKAKQAAEQANDAKDRFLAHMSHEIRTPLNGILGLCELLLGTRLGEDQLDYAEGIRTSAEHLMVIMNDVLDLSKIKAGKLELVHTPFSLRAIVGSAMQMVAHQAAKAGLACSCDIEEQVADRLVGDPVRLRQVLLNLANNAVKFTAEGAVVIAVQSVGETQARAALRFEVRDTGPGIAEADQTRIFDAFVQGDMSMRRHHGGTGLGLAIAKELCELMHGEIGVQSTLGQGATFWFTVELDKQELAQPARPNGGREPKSALPERNARILVVEDNAINQKVAAGMLEHLGYACEIAGSGTEALAAVKKAAYDLILMDCQMPEMDGLETTRALRMRAEEVTRRTPVVAMTAHAMPGDRQRCLDAGMDDYISKPIRLDKLRELLARWL